MRGRPAPNGQTAGPPPPAPVAAVAAAAAEEAAAASRETTAPSPAGATARAAAGQHSAAVPMAPPAVGFGMPPAPPAGAHAGLEDEALSDLLLAWYYSGYFAGRYQAIIEQRRQAQDESGQRTTR